MVKTLPYNAGGLGSIPGQGANIPHALQPKKQNINNKNNTAINSIKTFKMVHVEKNLKKKTTTKRQAQHPINQDIIFGTKV